MENFTPKFAPIAAEDYHAPFDRLPMKIYPAADTDDERAILEIEQTTISEFLSERKVDFLKVNLRNVYGYINNVFDCYCLEENSPEWDELCAVAWELKYRFVCMLKNNENIREFMWRVYCYLGGLYGSTSYHGTQNLFRIYAELAQKAI
jgi:hypothetical protein